jgi:DNA primase
MISRETIDKVYQTAIIEDVIGEFVQLKRSGNAFKGRSPFSNEKTPSFFVVPAKNIYKDFSSGKGGNVVDFLMQHEKLSYPEAIRWLAAKYNIEIEEDQASAEQLQEKSEREQLSIVTEFANKYFQQQLHESEEGQAIGLSYFIERGFLPETIKTFQLGYCPDKWDSMTKAAIDAGYNPDYLKKTGLTRERENGYYDFFRGRVMFPIHNISGKAIAFGGRTLKAEKDIAKYFNSPESELYIKSNVLYGLHLAKNELVKQDMCYLCEGYTDVIAMHQAGVQNVVSSSGTSLTEGQIRLIKRYTHNITILFDGDSAGIKASFRGIDMILKEGMNVRVLLFPDGDDPDSFSRKHSSSEIQAFITGHSRDFIRFKTELLAQEAGEDPIKRAALIRNIVESIALIPDAITRGVFVQECARLLQMQEQTILTELNKLLLTQAKKSGKDEQPLPQPLLDAPPVEQPLESSLELTTLHQERDFIRLLLTYSGDSVELTFENEDKKKENFTMSAVEFLISSLDMAEIQLRTPIYRQILDEFKELVVQERDAVKGFTQHTNPEITSITSDLLTEKDAVSSNWSRHKIYPETEKDKLSYALQTCVYALQLMNIRMIYAEINALNGQAMSDEEADAMLMRKMELDHLKKVITQFTGIVILPGV